MYTVKRERERKRRGTRLVGEKDFAHYQKREREKKEEIRGNWTLSREKEINELAGDLRLRPYRVRKINRRKSR